MAINPNTDFSVGQVLTSGNANRWPRGVMALSNLTANTNIPNGETTRTSVSFTAVANRYYKISWYEPELQNPNAAVNTMYLRLDTTGGTILGTSILFTVAGDQTSALLTIVTTLSAGSRSIFARAFNNAATATEYRAASGKPAYLLVEDIGPA
jgi:hypothetical protein